MWWTKSAFNRSLILCRNGWTIQIPFGLWAWMGPGIICSRRIHQGKGQFLGKGAPIVKYRDFLPWAVQQLLSRSICCLRCGLGWAEGSTSSIVFTRLRQCALMGGYWYIGATWASWRIRLNGLSATACGLMSDYFDHLSHCAWVVDDGKCIVVTRVFVSVRGRMPTLLHGAGCNLGEW